MDPINSIVKKISIVTVSVLCLISLFGAFEHINFKVTDSAVDVYGNFVSGVTLVYLLAFMLGVNLIASNLIRLNRLAADRGVNDIKEEFFWPSRVYLITGYMMSASTAIAYASALVICNRGQEVAYSVNQMFYAPEIRVVGESYDLILMAAVALVVFFAVRVVSCVMINDINERMSVCRKDDSGLVLVIMLVVATLIVKAYQKGYQNPYIEWLLALCFAFLFCVLVRRFIELNLNKKSGLTVFFGAIFMSVFMLFFDPIFSASKEDLRELVMQGEVGDKEGDRSVYSDAANLYLRGEIPGLYFVDLIATNLYLISQKDGANGASVRNIQLAATIQKTFLETYRDRKSEIDNVMKDKSIWKNYGYVGFIVHQMLAENNGISVQGPILDLILEGKYQAASDQFSREFFSGADKKSDPGLFTLIALIEEDGLAVVDLKGVSQEMIQAYQDVRSELKDKIEKYDLNGSAKINQQQADLLYLKYVQ